MKNQLDHEAFMSSMPSYSLIETQKFVHSVVQKKITLLRSLNPDDARKEIIRSVFDIPTVDVYKLRHDYLSKVVNDVVDVIYKKRD